MLWLAVTLTAIVGILASIRKVQEFACSEGLTSLCANQFTLSVVFWRYDIPGGWEAVITNPTKYPAEIIEATLTWKAPETKAGKQVSGMRFATFVIPSPENWQTPSTCASRDSDIPYVVLKPEAPTHLRLMLYAGPQRTSAQKLMATAIPNFAENGTECELALKIQSGDGHTQRLLYKFLGSRLPMPACH